MPLCSHKECSGLGTVVIIEKNKCIFNLNGNDLKYLEFHDRISKIIGIHVISNSFTLLIN